MEERFGKRRCATKAGKLVFLYVLLTMVFGPATLFAAMQDLGTLGGSYSRAYAINKTGQVVGGSLTSSEEMHPFLYSKGTMKDLGTFGGRLERARTTLTMPGRSWGTAKPLRRMMPRFSTPMAT